MYIVGVQCLEWNNYKVEFASQLFIFGEKLSLIKTKKGALCCIILVENNHSIYLFIEHVVEVTVLVVILNIRNYSVNYAVYSL